MKDDLEQQLSLRPEGEVGRSNGLPRRATLQAMVVCILLLLITVAGFLYTNDKVAQATTVKQDAEARKAQVDLQSQRLQAQLTELEGAGGTERLDTIKEVSASRISWKNVILAIGRSAPEGLTLDGFNGSGTNTTPSTSSSSGETEGPGANAVNLTGRAISIGSVQNFIRDLRKREVIQSVELMNANRSEGSVGFTLSVNIKAPPALPSADPSEPAPSGDAESAAPQNTPQSQLTE
jgi:hypothetical protein